jgi:FkbM family methyltransferase
MFNLRSFVRAVLPQCTRERIYHIRLYIQNFGVMKGLNAYYKLSTTKSGVVKLSIPQSKTKIAIRVNTSDISAFRQIFFANNSDYDIPMNIKPKVIVDGGANAGYASIYFANKYPEAQIIAVEPEISNVEILRENASLYPNVKILQAGIWNRRTFLRIVNQQSEKWAFQVQESNSREQSIEALMIEDIMELANTEFIDILKLDIEGAEKEVFASSQGWLDKVGILIVELHDKFKPGCRHSFYSAVSKFNFKEFHKGENIILVKDLLQNDVYLR